MVDGTGTSSGAAALRHPHQLRDSFQRRIDYLRISVTDRCNLDCIYCSPGRHRRHLAKERFLERREILRLVELLAARGLRKVRITGGEPLLRKDLPEIIAGLKALGIPDISLTSNGTLLARQARALRQAGLQRVNISLDTLNPDRYRGITRGGDIAGVWRAIETCRESGLVPIKLNVVPIRGLNDDEIADFARLTLEHDYRVRFIELMPVAGCHLAADTSYVSSRAVLEQVQKLGRLERLPGDGRSTSRDYRLAGARGIIGIISPYSGHFCRTCNRLRLSADGRIYPCLFSPKNIDVATALRSGAGDEELQQLLTRAAAQKPRGNELAEKARKCIIPAMSRIGG